MGKLLTQDFPRGIVDMQVIERHRHGTPP
jgi:hypothetical protein